MTTSKRGPRSGGATFAALALAAAFFVAGCAEERVPMAPEDGGASALAGSPAFVAALACTAQIQGGTFSCAAPAPDAPAGTSALIVGGQHLYVTLTSSNVSYDGATEVFQADVTVQNLIPQALGTPDGTTVTGVRVFFESAPAVTACVGGGTGCGPVTVANATGTGTFTAAGQPYFEYAEALDTDSVSAAKTWEWNVPSTVESFAFTVYVDAEVPHPDGWVELDADSAVFFRGNVELLTATVRDAVGNAQPGATVTWTSTDEAVVDVTDGLATAVADADTVLIVASSGAATPDTLTVEVTHLTQIATGSFHSCAIAANGRTYCWGQNFYGALGNGESGGATTIDRTRPGPVATAVQFTELAAGGDHTCGLTSGGLAYCWGHNNSGQLGIGGYGTDSPVPAAVDLTNLTSGGFAKLVAGSLHTCGVALTFHDLYCWGDNDFGQLGNGNDGTPSDIPINVAASVAWVTSGVAHVCMREIGSNDTSCWGLNNAGQLGGGMLGGESDTAVAVVDTILGFGQFSTLAGHAGSTCATASGATVYCWGDNAHGQLGNGDESGTDSAVPVAVSNASTAYGALVQGKGFHICSNGAGNQVYCWGENTYGQLGNGAGGSGAHSSVPVAVDQTVDGGIDIGWIDLGANHSCAVTLDGRGYCWGSNGTGQLGDGTMVQHWRPAPIANPVR